VRAKRQKRWEQSMSRQQHVTNGFCRPGAASVIEAPLLGRVRGNFAFGWFADLPDYLFGGLAFCSFSRLALGLDLLRSFAFCLCGSLPSADSSSWSLS
jgi:hypothetical protein